MSRRRRDKRSRTATADEQTAGPRDHMARVRVTDEVWAEFRAAAGRTPLTIVLGKLVEGEVARARSRRLRDGELDDRELRDALDRAQVLRHDLEAILAQLEARRGLLARPPQSG